MDMGISYQSLCRHRLTWRDATGDNVDVYRNETKVETTPNDGAYTDRGLSKNVTSAAYKVCETGGATCSKVVTVTW